MKKVLLLIVFSLTFWSCKNTAIINPDTDVDDGDLEISDILISEILPDPQKGGVEFVEIYNNSTRLIDLNSLQLATMNSTGKRSKLHSISSSTVFIYPFTYKLLSLDSEIVQAHYSVPDKTALHTMASFPTLTNSQGAVILFSDEKPIDSLYYTAGLHDVFIKDPKGVSLERVSFSKPTNSIGNFISAAATAGYATPGYQNSQLENKEKVTQTIFLSSKIFNPDREEQLEINFNFNQGGKMANIFIFNSEGKKIRNLVTNHRLGTKDRIFWNGEDDKKELLPVGVYLLSIEIYDAEGNFKKYKESCVLASKI